ncbi:putative glycerophosphodiester phosphodiesterase [Tanacetum coccineum]
MLYSYGNEIILEMLTQKIMSRSGSTSEMSLSSSEISNNGIEEVNNLVNCNSTGGNIIIGEQRYEIVIKFESSSSSVVIRNRTFGELVNKTSCEALIDNFTSPSPLLYSISINPFITLFKCTKNTTYAEGTNAYFNQPNYNSYNSCKYHNFYYEYSVSNATVPSDLPHGCQVIQLPIRTQLNQSNELNVTNLFSILSPLFSISIQLSTSCSKCKNRGGQCDTHNGKFQCLHAKKGVETGRRLIRVILLIGLSAGAATILIIIILCLKKKYGWRKNAEYNVNVEIFLKNQEFLAPKRYSYSQIKKMTNSFEVKIGQGGFGSVYRGELRCGNLVAVKILSELKGNGKDFVNEVASVGRTCHVNIVSLVGFCLEGRRRALVYEFMPNGSLEQKKKLDIDAVSSSNSHLGWEKLHQIAIGIARGLEYLHRGCNTRILHLDIKPHNILLDQDFYPKISDFGLAKLFPEKRSMISMTDMRGTPGYIAPELFSRSFGGVSHKSDVCSYGMMILEMVGGRKNVQVEVDHTSEIYFPHWIYKKIELHEEQLGLHGIVSEVESEMARKMIIVGLWCIQTNSLSRPTMTKVVEMLEGGLELLEMPPKPYMFSPSRSADSSIIE